MADDEPVMATTYGAPAALAIPPNRRIVKRMATTLRSFRQTPPRLFFRVTSDPEIDASSS
jgi:hypothetical protein